MAAAPAHSQMDLDDAAAADVAEVVAALGSSTEGLPPDEAARRLAVHGPNTLAVARHRWLSVLARQFHNPLLLLLAGGATVSYAVGQRADAIIILTIVAVSIGLGFWSEYRSEQAVDELHERIRHRALAIRDGTPIEVDVTDLVPGDVVAVRTGDLVPADLRLTQAEGLECDEAILTGESLPGPKRVEPAPPEGLRASSVLFMGTTIHAGAGRGIVVRTGPATELGRIATKLGERSHETAFQAGLRAFSGLLVRVAGVLTVAIFVINVALQRPLLEALLFSIAIAIGITPQLLPAIVTVSLSTGARHLVREKVVVKRLVAIEDLGNVDVLLTDKTGTLTLGAVGFTEAVDERGHVDDETLVLGLVASDLLLDGGHAVGGPPLDVALWEGVGDPQELVRGWRPLARLPFDHERRMQSVLVDDPGGRRLVVTKGAPEEVLARCVGLPPTVGNELTHRLDAGLRVVAVARRAADGRIGLGPDDEHELTFVGLLTFSDPPKADAADSLARLRRLDVTTKVVTGDNDRVARSVCDELGLHVEGTLTGPQIDALDDDALAAAAASTTVFARVTPEQKARIVRAARTDGQDVAFLGDGVNDAVALHEADVGISVDSGADVAKDAADIVLLDKDLRVLADGIAEGRRIFANTVKYVMMASSSNVGNMVSAAGASLFLPFLPMLPTQILLNNLLYDVGQLSIPLDRVDPEQLARPAHWDVGSIRRFMATFAPISSLFDFLTFWILLVVLNAGVREFRTGWFVESLATQTLVVFVIRTRRIPFVRSAPSPILLVSMLTTALVGLAIPYTRLAEPLGFVPLPARFLAILAVMIVAYLGLAELGKAWFYRAARVPGAPLSLRRSVRERRLRGRVIRFSRRRRATKGPEPTPIPGPRR